MTQTGREIAGREIAGRGNGKKIAIVGGGIAGVMAAIKIAQEINTEIHLFEKNGKLLQGGPWCHLHAGGMLYPMISKDDALELLYDSLSFALFFQESIIHTPCIVAYRKESTYSSSKLLSRCMLMESKYSEWSKQHDHALPLGTIDSYFAMYTREDMEYFKNNGTFEKTIHPFHDSYVKTFCKLLKNIDDIKYPFVSVREPIIDMDMAKSKLKLLLSMYSNIHIHTNAFVENISKEYTQANYVLYNMTYNKNNKNYIITADFLINAAGFESRHLLSHNRYFLNNVSYKNLSYMFHHIKSSSDEQIECKASFIINIESFPYKNYIPEMAIIGERGTQNGMIQITPTKHKNHFQIHAMMENSSLIREISFDNQSELYFRTHKAIEHVYNVFHGFYTAQPSHLEPLWGIQRTVGKDHTKRTSTLIFEKHASYAEIQLVKGISSVSLASLLAKQLQIQLGPINPEELGTIDQKEFIDYFNNSIQLD